jgi:DNA-directed RNA polymerase specialized sigma24 family protein
MRHVLPALAADAGGHLDPPIMRAIARGDRTALTALFDRTAAAVRADLAARVPAAEQRAPILAATYVEVWWLARCRGAHPDVTHWLGRIVGRRVADAHRTAGSPVLPEPRPCCAERELAGLLNRPVDRLWPR